MKISCYGPSLNIRLTSYSAGMESDTISWGYLNGLSKQNIMEGETMMEILHYWPYIHPHVTEKYSARYHLTTLFFSASSMDFSISQLEYTITLHCGGPQHNMKVVETFF